MKCNSFAYLWLLISLSLLACSKELASPEEGATPKSPQEPKRVEIAHWEPNKPLLPDGARELAESLFKVKGSDGRSFAGWQSVKSVEVLKDSINEPLFYLVNYQPQGFAILSARKSYFPVLAQSSEGALDVNNLPFPLRLQLEGYRGIIEHPEQLSDSVRQAVLQSWLVLNPDKKPLGENTARSTGLGEHIKGINEALALWVDRGYQVCSIDMLQYGDAPESLVNWIRSLPVTDPFDPYGDRQRELGEHHFGRYKPESSDFDRLKDYLKPYCPSGLDVTQAAYILIKNRTMRTEKVLPLKTKWEQNWGYNKYTPNNYPAGCVAVAVGQILHYLRPSSLRYDWDAMNLTGYGSDETARFLSDIGKGVKMKYGRDGSGSDIDKALNYIRGALKIGSKKADYKDYLLVSAINRNRPVYLRASAPQAQVGHAFVGDGYKVDEHELGVRLVMLDADLFESSAFYLREYFSEESKTQNSFFVHLNLGWGGYADGFYRDGIFAEAQSQYTEGRKAIYID